MRLSGGTSGGGGVTKLSGGGASIVESGRGGTSALESAGAMSERQANRANRALRMAFLHARGVMKVRRLVPPTRCVWGSHARRQPTSPGPLRILENVSRSQSGWVGENERID